MPSKSLDLIGSLKSDVAAKFNTHLCEFSSSESVDRSQIRRQLCHDLSQHCHHSNFLSLGFLVCKIKILMT
jgi:hypothetical protein